MAQQIAMLLWVCLMAAPALAYMPHDAGPKEPFFTDVLLRELVERMGKDLVEGGDSSYSYSEFDPRLTLLPHNTKEIDPGFDYDGFSETLNPNPSIRDQEFLQHSTLWGQYLANANANDNKIVRPEVNSIHLKPDSALPAYCNPPNPCPVGYTEEHGCILNFENTAAFSREYQSDQECMCDGEHMFECPGNSGPSESSASAGSRDESRLDRLLSQQMQLEEHKNLVAKKYHVKKDSNPYLTGEKLPVAAKKGINVDQDAED